MKVKIKKFSVDMDVKNSGVEFAVYSNANAFVGDAVLTKSGIVWCEGKTQVKNGKRISWDEFRSYMNSRA